MKKIKMELSEQAVKLIMEVLTQVSLPYATTAPVIDEVTEQIKKQEKK